MGTDTRTGADLFVDALERYGVTHVFGNPGTTELPVVQALGDADLEYVLALHEDIAVGMAAGYASTRRYDRHRDPAVCPVGVVNLHIAPGLAHGLGNLYGAHMAGAPLVVTAGNHSGDFRHEEPILSGDLVDLAEQWTKWSAEVLDVEALPGMLRRAFRVAMTPPTGPVFLGLPLDVMLAETAATPERLGEIPSAGRGDRGQVERAADMLAAAENPVLVVGDGVARSGADAVDAAVALAEAASARVHGEILSAEVNFPTTHDQWVSFVPPDEEAVAVLQSTDLLVFAGTSTHTTLTRHDGPLVGETTECVYVGDDAWELGKNHPADAAVLGDPGDVLAELADIVTERVSEATREDRLERVAMMQEVAASQVSDRLQPSADSRASKFELAEALKAVAGDAYVVDEGVTAKYAMQTRWEMQPAHYLSNKGGGLGYGLPAAVGAAVAQTERAEPTSVVGFVGDGSYLYYPHTLYTAARYDLDLTVVVVDNRNYRILKDNTVKLLGGVEEDHDFVGMDFEPPVDIPANAESHGARGVLVEAADDIAAEVEAAMARSGPDVVDVLVHD